MADCTFPTGADDRQSRLLATLERLTAIEAVDLKGALDEASQLVAEALGADKVDAFLHDPTKETLVAVGTSNTPMGRLQHAIGLERLPVANGGRVVRVFQAGEPFITGRSDQDPDELIGVKEGLGVRSTLATPFEVNHELRGVLSVVSAMPDRFGEEDLRFLSTAARWVGMLAHRAELVERIARDAAEQARRLAAEELVMILAHDFRAPLAPVQGRLDFIRKRAEREGRERDVRDAALALRALQRLERLINDLLDVSRIEQGAFALAPKPTDLAELVQQTADTLANDQAPARVLAPEELIVEIDPERIRQALENLISNAHKHSPDGVPIELVLGSETRADGEWATIIVRDLGPGVPAELLPNLFSRFGRGSGGSGLGLGLFIAREIAKAHGGALALVSPPGQGAAFQLSLPIAQPGA